MPTINDDYLTDHLHSGLKKRFRKYNYGQKTEFYHKFMLILFQFSIS